jgi:hypothetical protein
MRIAREEVFGPVLSIIGFDTEEDAVRVASDTIYVSRPESGLEIWRGPYDCRSNSEPGRCG